MASLCPFNLATRRNSTHMCVHAINTYVGSFHDNKYKHAILRALATLLPPTSPRPTPPPTGRPTNETVDNNNINKNDDDDDDKRASAA